MAEDPWADFPGAAEPAAGDPWAGFPAVEEAPEAKREAKPKPKRKRNGRRAEPASPVVDGDTLRQNGGTLRLWGVDAPELAQQGWGPNALSVPVGQQSRNALLDLIDGNSLVVGASQGSSFGRTVAPIMVGGVDVGRQLVREGNALAAPSFVASDPDYRFQLMQDERLARQNRLGPVHDNYVRPPAEHRENPDYVVPREDVAQFFDTPTPWAGLRPEVERQFVAMINDPSVPPEAIAEYIRENGGTVDPAEIAAKRAAAEKAGVPVGMEYHQPPEVLTDTGTGASGAAVRGIGEGFVAGGLAELGAVPDALGLTAGRENIWNSDRRLADIVANNYRQNEAILGFDEFAHPTASTLGQVGGAVTSGFVIPYGQGARTVPQLAGVGAAYGGLEGFLGTDGGVAERTIGAIRAAPVGGAINAVGGKAIEAVAPLAVRVFNRVTGRNAPAQAGEVAADAVEGYGEDRALEAVQRAPQGREGGQPRTGTPAAFEGAGAADEWADFPVAPDDPATMAMDAEPMPSVSGEVRQRDVIDVTPPARPGRMDQPLTETQTRAITAGIEPRDVLPMPSNVVDTVEEAARANSEGRIVPATAPHERGALTNRKVRNYAGVYVPKVGPIDLVGFLRLRGGLQDQGGELRAMGITSNAARKGLDFVGQETRFGPMVSERGMTLDDAADAAWREGYFPEMVERPTVAEFLDGLRDTYEGSGRRFLPDDLAEIDAYYGRQAERFDLQEREFVEGGPIYEDRSVPGDENAPFAPPEAYEEWPAESVKRAGNIDLDKLETPQDIKRALVQVNNRVGFDAATRGRVTQAETERLATELGMTADDLLKRRKGQALNAEEALAARQILAKSGNELVNLARKIQQVETPGDAEAAAFQRALLRHAAIQEQVSGATAEAGRALAQFKMMAKSRAVNREILATVTEHGGGPKRVKQAADMILDAIEGPPGRFNTVARKAANPKFADKLAELYINFLLSGPQTHVVNAISNAMTAISQIPENVLAAGIGGARRAANRKEIDRVMAGEIGARLFGLLQGTQEGARFFARAIRTGETSDTFSKIAGHDLRAIGGIKGEVVRVPGRLLNSADEFFKGMNRRAEINALAYRQAHRDGLSSSEAIKRRVAELSANPPEAIELRALDFARYQTFQRPLSGIGQNAQRMVRDYPLLRPIITFVRTPANLLKFATERSPLAPILKEWRADFKAGGARRDMAIARATLGTGIGALAYQWALDGRITGAPPSDPAKNRLMRANGWQPYSVRIGDTWVSYSRLDPFAMTLGVAADLATRSAGMTDKQLDNYAALTVASIMSQMADKTWLSGVSDFINAMSDPERYGPNYLRNLGASFLIPNTLGQTARSMDPVQRKRNSFAEELQSRIPGLSDNLLPSRNIWGEPIGRDQLGPDLLSPFRQERLKNDPVNQAMLDVGARFGLPSKSYTVDGVRKDWTPEQYDRLQELAGRSAYSGVAELISDPAWQDMTAPERLKRAEKVFRKAREAARDAILAGAAGEPERTDATVPAGWEDFGADGGADQWGGFEVVPQRDYVGELERAIPGVRFTSGFRTLEYQQDMKARGYNPSDSSDHLKAGALDMLPPPGRSLGWLRREVGRVIPEARLLVHDGHLHASIPDWNGAPVLGPARQFLGAE